MKKNLSFKVVIIAIFVIIAHQSKAQTWLPSSNPTSTGDSYRTGKVTIGMSTIGVSKLHVFSESSNSQMTVCGGAAGIRFNEGIDGNYNEERANIGIATVAGHYFSSSGIHDFIFRANTATGNILFGTGNAATEKMRIASNGNVGIGISPSYKLHVNGTIASTGFKLGTTSTTGYVLMSDANGNGTWQSVTVANTTPTWLSNGSSLYNANAGNVGIGTNTPASKLEVNGTIASTGFKLGTTSTAGYILTTDANGNGTWQSPANSWLTNGTSIYNPNSGNVGIGLSSPLAKLHIVNGESVLWANNSELKSDQGGSIELGANNSTVGTGRPYIDFHHNGFTSDYNVRLINNDTKQLLLLGGGFYISHPVSSNPIAGLAVDVAAFNDATHAAQSYFFRAQNTSTNKTHFMIQGDGKVGVGTTCIPSDGLLAVNGKIYATSFQVKLTDANGCFPDYVFEKDYKLLSLTEVEKYINTNKHLPEIPSASEVEEKGVDLGEMNKLLLKKIEELTLYMIEMKKEIEILKSK